jgi:hypothetical protein
MNLESLKVWAQIVEAFPPALPQQPVTTCNCEECRDVHANLGHLRWDEVLPPAIEKHFGSLPLLTENAFQVLLPAYLFHALCDVSEQNKILEWTLFGLCAVYDENNEGAADSDARLRQRTRNFTMPQRAAVRAFLALVSATPGISCGHRDAIAHALDAVWS